MTPTNLEPLDDLLDGLDALFDREISVITLLALLEKSPQNCISKKVKGAIVTARSRLKETIKLNLSKEDEREKHLTIQMS